MTALNTTNLGDVFNDSAYAELALVDCRNWENPVTHTYRELNSAANSFAVRLTSEGLRQGDVVAILSSNRAEFMIAFLGILRAGLIAVPINYKFSKEIIKFISSKKNRI